MLSRFGERRNTHNITQELLTYLVQFMIGLITSYLGVQLTNRYQNTVLTASSSPLQVKLPGYKAALRKSHMGA